MADLTDAMQHGKKKSKKANKNDGDKQGVKPPNPGAAYFNALFDPVIGLVQEEMQLKIDESNGDIHVTKTQARTIVYNQGYLDPKDRKQHGVKVMATAFHLDRKKGCFDTPDVFENTFSDNNFMRKVADDVKLYIENNYPNVLPNLGVDSKARNKFWQERDMIARRVMQDAYLQWVTSAGDKDDDSLGGEHEEIFMDDLPIAQVLGIVHKGKVVRINDLQQQPVALGGNGAAAPVPPSSPPPPGVGNVSAPVEKDDKTDSEDDAFGPVGKQDKQPEQKIKVKIEEMEVQIKRDPDGPAGGPAGGAAEGAARSGTMRQGITREERQRRAEKRKATIEEAEEEEPEVIEID